MREWLRVLSDGVKRAGREMAGELKQMGAHGAHELSAAIFTGSAHVMYPRGTREDPQVGNAEHDAQKQIEREM